MKLFTAFIAFILISSCNESTIEKISAENINTSVSTENSDKIQVLNLGTFHMSYTSDSRTTTFDQHNEENRNKAHEIAEKLALFKPTVIIVEKVPEFNAQLQIEYTNYLKNPNQLYSEPSELELIAFELGRLCGTKKIVGIDHKMNYHYNIGNEIENSIDSVRSNAYYTHPIKYYPEINMNEDSLNLFEKLKLMNNDIYLDYLIAVNAEMLTFAGTENGFEGADEAAKYYQRNLRMFSNFNRVELNEDDRVFILMGASHTAFFRGFLDRCPKYEMVNTFDYLK